MASQSRSPTQFLILMTDLINQHYQKIANIYDDLWTRSPDFIQSIAGQIVAGLCLQPADVLVDLGCGTGIYTKEILNQLQLERPIICVDPSEGMLSKIPPDLQVQSICADAVTFAIQPGTYDKILIKDAIHLISDLELLFSHLFQRLSQGGIVLILVLPKKIDYPLFDKALRRYEEVQPDYQELANLISEVGFEVKIDFVEYPLSIEKSQYLQMVESRYMTVLSYFSDREIQAGLEEIDRKYSDRTVLEFTDRFVFIQALKKETYKSTC